MLGLNFLIENCVIDILILLFLCRFYVIIFVYNYFKKRCSVLFQKYLKKNKKMKIETMYRKMLLIHDTSYDSRDLSLILVFLFVSSYSIVLVGSVPTRSVETARGVKAPAMGMRRVRGVLRYWCHNRRWDM